MTPAQILLALCAVAVLVGVGVGIAMARRGDPCQRECCADWTREVPEDAP